MKNENIKKINTLGKVCRILLVFARVACIIGIVCCIIVACAFLALPDDIVTADGAVTGQIRVDSSRIPSIFSDDLVDLEERDMDFGVFGTGIKWNVIKWNVEESQNDKEVVYDINGELNTDNHSALIASTVGTCLAGAVMCAFMLVIVIFGGKFAKSLEICNSPFEENVLKSMKRFAFSLIPIGIFQFCWHGSISLTTLFIVIVIIILSFIFSYGAQLQQESDETL